MLGRNPKLQEITVSSKTVLRVILLIVASVFVFRLFENMVHPLTLIFVSFFLAMALNQVVSWIAKQLPSKNRTAATAISYVGVITVLILFFSAVVPPLINQTREFIADIPDTISDLRDDQGVVGNFVRTLDIEEQLDTLADEWSGSITRLQGPVVSTANRVVSNLVSIVTVLVLTFMMLVEGPRWLKAFWRHYPKEKRKHAESLASKMYEIVKNYVNGQVVVAAIGATFSIVAILIATAIFDVNGINAIALGGIVFLCSLIPTIGAILSASVVVLFSLFASVPLAITMLVYFIVYQQIENVTIQPIIQSRGNNLTPMLVFIAAILGIGLGGFLGAFVAIPVAGCARVLVDDYLERRELPSKL
jgi:predicted PurR-regulated permease PerM